MSVPGSAPGHRHEDSHEGGRERDARQRVRHDRRDGHHDRLRLQQHVVVTPPHANGSVAPPYSTPSQRPLVPVARGPSAPPGSLSAAGPGNACGSRAAWAEVEDAAHGTGMDRPRGVLRMHRRPNAAGRAVGSTRVGAFGGARTRARQGSTGLRGESDTSDTHGGTGSTSRLPIQRVQAMLTAHPVIAGHGEDRGVCTSTQPGGLVQRAF